MPRRFAALAVMILAAPLARADGDPKAVSYEKDVLPVLKQHCYKCHDAKKGTAGFRIDVRSAAAAGGESGKKGIVPGKSAESEIVRRMVATDEAEVMPPKGGPVPKEQIAAVKAWIDAGAKWPDALANEVARKHWAFETPVRPAVPPGVNPIDYFVGNRLAKDGLTPAPKADAITLARRLYLDILGLPPTPEEADAFAADKSPDAVAKLVKHLLASPHYGERQGRQWLDAARYADSDGYEKDKPRFVWFYRDWVINAFNRDLPYDQFIIEQLAGDLLPNPTQDQVVATGYLRNSMINEEGGIDPEQFRMEAMFDRMDAVGKGVLGLTIQCAQCHTHKYDPITHTDYYRMFAYLNNADEGSVSVYTPAEQMVRAGVLERIKSIEADLKHKHPRWEADYTAWKAKATLAAAYWQTLKPELDTSGGQKHTLMPDGSVYASGYAPTKHTTDFTGPVPLTAVTAVRLELLNDANLPRGGPGRSVFGQFALTEIRVELNGKPIKIASAVSDADPPERPLGAPFDDKSNRKRVTGPVAYAIDGKDETAWTADLGGGRSNQPRVAVFTFDKAVAVPPGAKLTVKLVQNHGGWNSDDNQNNNLGRFRISFTDVAGVVPAYPAVANFAAWRLTVPEWEAANAEIEAEWAKHPRGESQLALAERGEMRPTHLLKRGDFLKPAEKLTPGVPDFLHAADKDSPANRLGFAKWLTNNKSPTTARAYVNRVWQSYFGTGLVSTSEDLGTQAEAPSHPELLDWLACEFMTPTTPGVKPWSVKHIHSLIANSDTYQQASRVTPELLAKDPQNRLLARGPRFRVDAEVVRDVALAAGGLLNTKVGGPSVFPPVPGFLMLPPASYGPKVWPESTGPDRYRRSLYVFRFRSIPYPPLLAFDAPTGDFACVKRSRSNTPLQALAGLNEPVFVEAAAGLAAEAIKHAGPDAAKLAYAFRRCVARPPTAAEAAILAETLAEERTRAGEKAAPAVAWTAVARVLLNLDETVTKE